MVKRGCGDVREPGGIYIETQFSKHGLPLEYFLVDPPIVPLDTEGNVWKPSAQGLTVIQRPGTDQYDVIDWIGDGIPGYPFFPDFYEEGRRFEFSRRAQNTLDFSLLNKQSNHLYMHPKGMLKTWGKAQRKKLYQNLLPGTGIEVCPTHKDHHESMWEDGEIPEEFCVGLLWQLVDKPQPQGDRMHTVLMPRSSQDQFSYLAASPPKGMKIEWLPAVVLKLPIHRIVVIEDPFSEKDIENLEKVSSSGTDVPVVMVSE